MLNFPICVFLMTCFTNETIIDINNCPKKFYGTVAEASCDCYKAPKNGYIWREESTSLKCDGFPSKESLQSLTPINTFALLNHEIYENAPDRYFSNLEISNILLDGINLKKLTQTGKSQNDYKLNILFMELIKSNSNKLDQSLQVLTFLNLDLRSFEWRVFNTNKLLKAIHLENCYLTSLNKESFGSLKSLITLSIINSETFNFESQIFEGWNSLKMLTIRGNLIFDLNWLITDLPQLWYLDLRDNNIESIPTNFFTILNKLKVLKLTNNNIKTLDWKVLSKPLTTLKEFTLQEQSDNNQFEQTNNVLCMTKGVVEVFKQYKLLASLPHFFNHSMKRLQCKAIFNAPSGPCEKMIKDHPTSIAGDEECRKWTGQKPNDIKDFKLPKTL